MKLVRFVGLGIFLTVFGVSGASAAPISFSDTFDPVDVLFDGQSNAICTGNNVTDTVSGMSGGACERLTWTHVLAGYEPVLHFLSSASLTLTVRNNSGTNNQSDKFDIVLDVLPIDNTGVPDTTMATSITFSSSTFATLLTQLGDGQLVTALTGANGNHSFYLEKSVLTAEGVDRDVTAAAVPEPASLTLLGGGLIGGSAALRRRRKVS